MTIENIEFLKNKENSFVSKLSKIRCGFELETQSFDGMDFDGLTRVEVEPEYETDYDQVNEAVDDYLCQIRRDHTGASFRKTRTIKTILWANMSDALNKVDEEYRCTIVDIDDTTWSSLSDELWDKLVELSREAIEQYLIETGDYERQTNEDECNSRDIEDLAENYFGEPGNLTMEHDGSVNGPEIQTVGPKTVKEFLRLAKKVFKQEMTIDHECSFHIHVSVDGVKHVYGAMLQRAVYYYFYNNLDRVPESVMQRWANREWRDRYFAIEHNSDRKYSFVAWRNEHSTIEFRCFGNVTNYKDARKCLILAVEALIWAYTNRKAVPDNWDCNMLNTRIDNYLDSVCEQDERRSA